MSVILRSGERDDLKGGPAVSLLVEFEGQEMPINIDREYPSVEKLVEMLHHVADGIEAGYGRYLKRKEEQS